MRKILSLLFIVCVATNSNAQILTVPVGGGSSKAWVGERVGLTDIQVNYNRPAVKGREGKIWGALVPYGYTDLGFGTSKAAPWRAGADENTTISFSTDVRINEKPLAAGNYGFFIAMGENEAEIIFSSNTSSWGSYFYDPKEDALRVKVPTAKLNESLERLTYTFSDQKDNSAVLSLNWEKMRIPFTVSVDLQKTQMESMRRELRSSKGFNPDAYVEAINYSVANNLNLEEAVGWSDYAINAAFVGQKNFKTLSARAAVLNKLGRSREADSLMKAAMPMANMQELHQYGQQLIRMKRPADALAAYKLNAQKNPDNFTTLVGLVRGYSAMADYKNALKHARLALPKAPDKGNRDNVEAMIRKLEEGKDVN